MGTGSESHYPLIKEQIMQMIMHLKNTALFTTLNLLVYLVKIVKSNL